MLIQCREYEKKKKRFRINNNLIIVKTIPGINF